MAGRENKEKEKSRLGREEGGENEREREGDAWGQPGSHQPDMEQDIQNERKLKSPRQNVDEEKQVK